MNKFYIIHREFMIFSYILMFLNYVIVVSVRDLIPSSLYRSVINNKYYCLFKVKLLTVELSLLLFY